MEFLVRVFKMTRYSSYVLEFVTSMIRAFQEASIMLHGGSLEYAP